MTSAVNASFEAFSYIPDRHTYQILSGPGKYSWHGPFTISMQRSLELHPAGHNMDEFSKYHSYNTMSFSSCMVPANQRGWVSTGPLIGDHPRQPLFSMNENSGFLRTAENEEHAMLIEIK